MTRTDCKEVTLVRDLLEFKRSSGSLGSLVSSDWDVPIFTLEFVRGQPADEAWPSLRDGMRALLQAIRSEPQG